MTAWHRVAFEDGGLAPGAFEDDGLAVAFEDDGVAPGAWDDGFVALNAEPYVDTPYPEDGYVPSSVSAPVSTYPNLGAGQRFNIRWNSVSAALWSVDDRTTTRMPSTSSPIASRVAHRKRRWGIDQNHIERGSEVMDELAEAERSEELRGVARRRSAWHDLETRGHTPSVRGGGDLLDLGTQHDGMEGIFQGGGMHDDVRHSRVGLDAEEHVELGAAEIEVDAQRDGRYARSRRPGSRRSSTSRLPLPRS